LQERPKEVTVTAAATLPDLAELLRPVLETVPIAIRPRVIATLERAAAERYRAWATSCPDPLQAEGLRACALREEDVAVRVEKIFPSQPGEQQLIAGVLPRVAEIYGAAIAGRPVLEQYAFQAASERRGAALWRGLAASLPDAAREALDVCAVLEERSAEFLEGLVAAGPARG
jgi:hypothetical protein